MKFNTLAIAGVAAAMFAGSLAGASAQSVREVRHDRRASRSLTIHSAVPRPVPAYAYNPYMGPKAIITAPLALASTIVSLPFRVTDALFPYSGSPVAVVGAPIHYAGRIAQVPFRIVEAPFGGPSPFVGATYY